MRMWCRFICSFVLKVMPQMGHVAGVYTPSCTVLMWTFTLLGLKGLRPDI